MHPINKHTKHFYSGPDKNRAKKILNISRSHLTRLISIITGFNCLSYIQFKANPTINPLCRLCGEVSLTIVLFLFIVSTYFDLITPIFRYDMWAMCL